MKMSEEVVTFVFFTYFSQNFLEGGRTTKIAELINEAVVARAIRGVQKLRRPALELLIKK